MIEPIDTSFLDEQEAGVFHDSIKWTIWNHEYQQITLDSAAETKVETSFEFKFCRDLIRFVLQDYMTGLNWKPVSLFAFRDLNSPFTPQFKAAIKEELDSCGHKFHETYDFFFGDKSMVTKIHPEICKKFKNAFLSEDFNPKSFIRFCSRLSMCAGLSYLYGSILAPHQAFLELVTAVKEVKFMGQAGDEFWKVIQDWLESGEYDLKGKMYFWNRDVNHHRIKEDTKNAIETTFEFEFGKDLVCFALHEYMSALNWHPIGIFADRDFDSPFTPQIKAAIKRQLDLCGHHLGKIYNYLSSDEPTERQRHQRDAKFFKDAFVRQTFSPESFIKFSAFLALSASLYYSNDSSSAPYELLLLFITTIRELKQLRKVDDNLWNEIQDWVEGHKLELEKKNMPLCTYTNSEDSIDQVNEPSETTFEFKFSRDMIRFVLHEYMTGLKWIPVGMFDESDLDSPFTPQFKVVLKEKLDSIGHKLHEAYDVYFPDKSKVDEIHKNNCETFKNAFLREIFSPKRFMKFCSLMGMSAGLSFLYGSTLAPFRTLLVLISAIQELKTQKKVNERFWNGLQNWVECQANEIMGRKRIFKLMNNFKCY